MFNITHDIINAHITHFFQCFRKINNINNSMTPNKKIINDNEYYMRRYNTFIRVY